MLELNPQTAEDYLRRSGRIAASERVSVTELGGGVSNTVLLVRRLSGSGDDFVLKQARNKLRVAHDWFCGIERIWREAEVLRICSQLLERDDAPHARTKNSIAFAAEPAVPQILFEDRENYCFAMTAAPPESKTWKELLLAGEIPLSRGVATACGHLLGTLHARSWKSMDLAARLDDRSFFDQLRLDPYYRQVARTHPDLKDTVQRLIDSVWGNRLALVHGDFSPKNLLISQHQVLLIDFEVGHYGDPAFDLGFFLTHLVLKAFWSGPRHAAYMQLAGIFWRTYRNVLAAATDAEALVELERRMVANLAGCMLARIDGKSPVDYLPPPLQERVRQLSREMLLDKAASWEQAEGRIDAALKG